MDIRSLGFRARATVRGVFGEPVCAESVRLDRAQKNGLDGADGSRRAWYDRRVRQVRDCRAQDFGLFWNSKYGASRAAVAAP